MLQEQVWMSVYQKMQWKGQKKQTKDIITHIAVKAVFMSELSSIQ